MTGPSVTGHDEVLDGIPVLAGQARHVTRLPGGLTNTNLRVRTGTGLDVVVRLSDPGTGLLGVDRHAEFVNTLAAAGTGVGAPVVDYLGGRGILVVAFLPGRTWGDADVAANLPRLATALRRLHSAPGFVGRFDMTALRREYRRVVEQQGFALPPGYDDLEPVAERAEAALAARPEPLVPCHNDLLAANVLDDGGDLRIIDYEYSGMNEPSFELGNAAAEAGLDHEALAELCAVYHARRDPGDAARAELWGFLARYGWTLWGVIQEGRGEIDFDFRAWATEKLDAARELAGGPRWERLLAGAAGS